MTRQNGNAVLLITILLVSTVLLGWSIFSTWQTTQASATAHRSSKPVSADGQLPPKLESEEAKASLFYPAMKSRGPLPGGKLVAKPLDGAR